MIFYRGAQAAEPRCIGTERAQTQLLLDFLLKQCASVTTEFLSAI